MATTAQKSIVKRSPVVCVMGHIDHGKSTLLDYIRKTNIVDKEAGGITQRISAYEVIHKTPEGKEEKITFLDTPGHEAFGAMRVSGASVADIAILVVSAEDGVKKQTLEALKAIEHAGIPYIVAINKIDKPDANIEKTKNSLIENGIYIEGYGGSVPCVSLSAKTGKGVPELLDIVLLLAEVSELTGDPAKLAEGVVVEAFLDKQKGITAILVIKDGTLKTGMYVVSGVALAPTRIMEDFLGDKIREATFSSPVRIVGFDNLPEVGKPFKTFDNKNDAEDYIAEERERLKKAPAKIETEENPEEVVVRVMLKAAVAGALGALKHEIEKIKNNNVKIKVIGESIGAITENDVKLSSGRNPAIILGFDVGIDASAKALAERLGVLIQSSDIIYKVSEWLAEEVKRRIPKTMVEEVVAEAKILKVFSTMKDKHIIGARVEKGFIGAGQDAKLLRKDAEIAIGKIKGLERDRTKVSEVKEGMEFGCEFKSDILPAPGDKIQIVRIVEQ
jgi:translation initiation factor IF-2